MTETTPNPVTVEVRDNAGKIELHFSDKPAQEILNMLKGRWSFIWRKPAWTASGYQFKIEPVMEYLCSMADDEGNLPGGEPSQREKKEDKRLRLTHRLGTCEPRTLAPMVAGEEKKSTSRKTEYIESLEDGKVVERFFLGANQLEALKCAILGIQTIGELRELEEKKGTPAEA